MAYNVSNNYKTVIYSQDDDNDVKVYFNGNELENASEYISDITVTSRIFANDGNNVFSLDNFISKEVDLTLYDVDVEDIVDQVEIQIGTLVGNAYEYVPLGLFNIQDTPKNENGKISLKLRDNRVKFDFNYDASPLIETGGGTTTKGAILNDICTKAGVTSDVSSFQFSSDEIGVYDSTITATQYVSYLAEQAGCIAVITRQGHLAFIDLSNVTTWEIPLSLLGDYKLGTPYSVDRVVFESGIVKYETSNDETLDTLYLNANNPYINRQEQVDYVYNKLKNITIDSVTVNKVLGNPAIDPYDLIQVYDDEDNDTVVFTTFANNVYKFTGVHRHSFNTTISKAKRTENVTLTSEATNQRYVKTQIDNINATLTNTVGEVSTLTTTIGDIESSVNYFTVDMPRDTIVIATDSNRYPIAYSTTYTISYDAKFKGSTVRPTVSIEGNYNGLTVSQGTNAIYISCSSDTQISSSSDINYTVTFTYQKNGTTYTTTKKIIITLAIAGESSYTHIRYSRYSDGQQMTIEPNEYTEYMGVAVTNSEIAPTSYWQYTWSQIQRNYPDLTRHANGSTMYLTNVNNEYPQSLILYGDSYQLVGTGKNKLSLKHLDMGVVEADFFYKSETDSTIAINGGGAYNTRFTVANDLTLRANTTYTFSLSYISGSFTVVNGTTICSISLSDTSNDYMTITLYSNTYNNNNYPKEVTFTPTQDIVVNRIHIYCNGNGILENLKYGLQLEEGDTSSSFEPYTNGLVVPSQANPSTIYVTTGLCELKINGIEEDKEETFYFHLTYTELAKIIDEQTGIVYADYIYNDEDKWYKYKNIEKISSYNGETINTPYISSTGSLTTGATVYYVIDYEIEEIVYQTLINDLNTFKNTRLFKGTNYFLGTNDFDLPIIFDFDYFTEYWQDTTALVQDDLDTLDQNIADVNNDLTDRINTTDQNLATANENMSVLQTQVTSLIQEKDNITIQIKNIQESGATKVETSTGYRFDENGLDIQKSGEVLHNTLDNTGMFVKRKDGSSETEVLGADATGVRAENVTVRNWLIIGSNSRMEDFEDGTGVFYIGGGS